MPCMKTPLFLVPLALVVPLSSRILAAPVPSAAPAPTPVLLAAPPQDQGLPYTRSARKAGLAKIGDRIAVFAGSRYAYVNGFKVRLDSADIRHGEAVLKEGEVWVPAAFAGVLDLKTVSPKPAPAYLADRWVYSLPLPAATAVPAVDIDGKPYVALGKLAETKGLKVYRNPRGLLLIGKTAVGFTNSEGALLDTVVTLFDTPEKFADPDVATRWIPALKRQGKWTDYVKVTPEQMAILNGPETKWPTAPKSAYDFTGLDARLLGSKVPAPGVYPRVLFSPEDVPMLAARVKGTKMGQMALIEMEHLFKKSFWDPATSDGQVFRKLASGDVAGLEWDIAPGTLSAGCAHQFKGQKAGIYSSHIAYVPECLTAMALYCLLDNDDVHGREVAAAIASYYKLREPLIDEYNAISDSEFGSSWTRPDGSVVPMNGNGGSTHWRTMHGAVAHMNLGLALDFAGKWMNAAEKESMRRFIVKATYGRRAYGQDMTVRVRDVNWVGWDLPHFLALTAIEGLEGFDREAYESNRDTVRAFCDWGIDDSGVVYESNGKTPGSFQFITLSMVALARRGENLWGHPHWRTQMTSPNGKVTVNSGTQYSPFSRQALSLGLVDELKAFFPNDRRPDYLLAQANQAGKKDEYLRQWSIDGFDAESYRAGVAKIQRLRLPSPTYPGFVHGVLYDADFKSATRAELNLPLDFDAPTHGVFSSYSDTTPEAAWMNIMVRPNHYLGAGHHHADAGMFHFSALGVDWFTQSPFSGSYDGKYFNLVQIDGHSEAEPAPGINGYNAPAKYLGAVTGPGGACASAYSYRWQTQPSQVWDESVKAMPWELDPSPQILKIFAGTARYKMRPWWSAYTFSNYIATSRAPFNPMKHVFRTAGLVRGAHPYGFLIDDAKKDDAAHLYQWAAMLNGGVWKADAPGVPAGCVALAFREMPANAKPEPVGSRPAIVPAAGEPLLLVVPLEPAASGDGAMPLISVETREGAADRKGIVQTYDRLTVNVRATEARFKVLLIPFRMGDPLPRVSFDAGSGNASLAWKDQTDRIAFKAASDSRTQCVIRRGDTTVLESK